MDCQARSERMAAAQRSRQIDCGICLERVLEKTNAADRQFGLLECEHAFCLACIRGWRSHLSGGADLDSVRPHRAGHHLGFVTIALRRHPRAANCVGLWHVYVAGPLHAGSQMHSS